MVSVKIRHGSVLIRHPNSAARDEEFEASSLSFDTKNEAYSWLTSNPVYNTNKSGNFSSRGNDKSRMPITTTTNTNTVGHRIYYHSDTSSNETPSSNVTSSDGLSSDKTYYDDSTKKPKTTPSKGPIKELLK
ncbi:hypothetical protein Tco_1416744 [Tanacetum coccineum]